VAKNNAITHEGTSETNIAGSATEAVLLFIGIEIDTCLWI